MVPDMDKLLRLVADYHNFCTDDCRAEGEPEEEELHTEELDMVFAAAALPGNNPNTKSPDKK